MRRQCCAHSTFAMSAMLLGLSGLCGAGEPANDTPPPARGKTDAAKDEKVDPFDTAVKEGRDLFKKKLFVEALDRFALALTLKPENRDAAMLAGLAAFWARNPQRALEFWNELLDTAKRNTVEEFEIEAQRVMALYAMKQVEAAEAVVERIYELRRKVPALKSVDGYVREQIFIKDPAAAPAVRNEKILRIGCKESFDERNEAQRLWIFAVVAQSEKDEPLLKRLTVETAVLPGGEAGYILAEDSNAGRRVFKRWLQKPQYPEVRTLLLQAVTGKVQPIEGAAPTVATTPDPAKKSPDGPPESLGAPPKKLDAPESSLRIFNEQEMILAERAKTLSADPAAQQVLTIAARLREVDLDVTRLTRLSLSDPLMAGRYLDELKAKAPYAQEDAADLVDQISKAKPVILAEVFLKLNKLGPRLAYLDYALLTGLNTRGRELAPSFLKECQKSPDFMVRQTAALMLARAGGKKALGFLFKEVETADALVSGVLYDSLSELLGKVFPAPPPPGNDPALKDWKHEAVKWWQQNEKKVTVFPDRAAADAYFKVDGK